MVEGFDLKTVKGEGHSVVKNVAREISSAVEDWEALAGVVNGSKPLIIEGKNGAQASSHSGNSSFFSYTPSTAGVASAL